MIGRLFTGLGRVVGVHLDALNRRFIRWTTLSTERLPVAVAADLARSKPALIAENALLRQQLIVLQRHVVRPRLRPLNRLLLVVLASRIRLWRAALLIVQPDTVLRWHRHGFRLVWKARSRATTRTPRVPVETVALIVEMVRENRLWGAERIRGELLKLGVRVSKGTILTHMRRVRPPRRSGQSWATFLRNHAADIWACDVIQITDLCCRSLVAFVMVEHASRRVVHVGVTRHPTDAWVAQQLREATPFGTAPRFLIHDNDATYGAQFERVATTTDIDVLTTPYRAPRANALCERFIGSVRRECLDHLLILHERHLAHVLRSYVAYFNRERPHQGIGQAVPDAVAGSHLIRQETGRVERIAILGGLHHAYRHAACYPARA
jgi:putative transposase